jgi:GNAT superfamily N-acetyltransferase
MSNDLLSVRIDECGVESLAEYATIPMAYLVKTVFDVVEIASDRFELKERSIDIPFVKDYGSMPEQSPLQWPLDFDTSNWRFFLARHNNESVGAAAVAFDTSGVDMLEGRRDLAVLWDIRVHPDARGKGIGSLLFQAVEEWARSRDCKELKVETQNINIPACRFYERQGCLLRKIRRDAYVEFLDEIQLLWYKYLLSAA